MSWQMWASLSSLLPLNMIILWCTLRLKARQSQRSLLTSSIFCFCIFSYRHISSCRHIIICSTNVVQTVYQGEEVVETHGGDKKSLKLAATPKNGKKWQKMAQRSRGRKWMTPYHHTIMSWCHSFFLFSSFSFLLR